MLNVSQKIVKIRTDYSSHLWSWTPWILSTNPWGLQIKKSCSRGPSSHSHPVSAYIGQQGLGRWLQGRFGGLLVRFAAPLRLEKIKSNSHQLGDTQLWINVKKSPRWLVAANVVCALHLWKYSEIGTQEAVKSKYLGEVEVEVGVNGRELLFILSCSVLSEKSIKYFVYMMKSDFKENIKIFLKETVCYFKLI